MAVHFKALWLLPFLFAAPCAHAVEVTVRTPVFSMGDHNSLYYRIPAIAELPDGTLVAVADKRINDIYDLPGDIDIVARRSTDGGRTWGPYIDVAVHDEDGGYGDPAIVYDSRTGRLVVVCLHGMGLWGDAPGQITVLTSDDAGLTWSEPRSINPGLLTGENPPIECVAAFATSGSAVQLADGRLMFALVTRRDGMEGFPVYAVYSDDGGDTWHCSGNPATLDGDESKIAQLSDGRLMMSIRSRKEGNRKFSVSDDRGDTWTLQPDDYAALHDVACNGDFRIVSGDLQTVLFQSLPAGPERRNITLYASNDMGRTWGEVHRVQEGYGAYSSYVLHADGTVSMLTEEGRPGTDGYDIWYTRIDLGL